MSCDRIELYYALQFIVVQESHSTSADLPATSAAVQLDAKVRKTFDSLHDAYLDLVSSPFYTPNTPINPESSVAAKKFEEAISVLLEHSPSPVMTSNL